MKKNCIIFAILYLLVSCTSIPDGFKELDVKEFKISVPKNWDFKDPGDQEDSFVGYITGPNLTLFFDCSDMGYANHLDEIVAKDHHIEIDSSGNYIVRTIHPKVPGKGMTGVYIKSKSSSFKFQMNGENLSPNDQQLALTAFKTITFNK